MLLRYPSASIFQNSENLGMRPSSKIFVDKEDGNAKCASMILLARLLNAVLRIAAGRRAPLRRGDPVGGDSAVTAGLDDLPHASDISLIRAYAPLPDQ